MTDIGPQKTTEAEAALAANTKQAVPDSPQQPFRNDEFITIVSGDGFEFAVSKNVAQYATYFKDYMKRSDAIPGQDSGRIVLKDICGAVLEMVVRFLHERAISGGTHLNDFAPLRDLDPTSDQDRKMVIEILLASHYLDC